MNRTRLIKWLAENVTIEQFNTGSFTLPKEALVFGFTWIKGQVDGIGFMPIKETDVRLAKVTSGVKSGAMNINDARKLTNTDGFRNSGCCPDYGHEWTVEFDVDIEKGPCPSCGAQSPLSVEQHSFNSENDGVEPVQLYSATNILKVASDNIGDRASERDTEQERSMKATVASFNAMYGTNITEEQGWMFMVFLKAARAKGGDFRDDDYVDGASYFALAGECAASERG